MEKYRKKFGCHTVNRRQDLHTGWFQSCVASHSLLEKSVYLKFKWRKEKEFELDQHFKLIDIVVRRQRQKYYRKIVSEWIENVYLSYAMSCIRPVWRSNANALLLWLIRMWAQSIRICVQWKKSCLLLGLYLYVSYSFFFLVFFSMFNHWTML